MCVCVPLCGYVNTVPAEARGFRSPGAGGRFICELCNVGFENLNSGLLQVQYMLLSYELFL